MWWRVGIIFNPEGNHETIFQWGLEGATNNQVQVLSLYQDLCTLDSRRIMNLLIIEDSKIVIKHMPYFSTSKDFIFTKLILRIQEEARTFMTI
jgi:ribonuclease HI